MSARDRQPNDGDRATPDLEVATPRLTALGAFVIWSGLAMLAAGVFRYDGTLIWLGLAALGAVGVARWWAPRNLAGLAVSRRRPARVFAGEPFVFSLTVTRPVRAGWALPRTGCGVEIRDPWLPRRGAGLSLGTGLVAGETAAGERRSRLVRRGRDGRTTFELRSRFPMGIFLTAARGHLHDETLARDGGVLVYPQPLLPEALRRDLEMAWLDRRHSQGFEIEPGDEFRGIRAYRSSDPVKAVHWPATARAGSLMVREWDPPAPRPQRYGMILHTLERGGRLLRPDRWETALRVATGLITHCRDRQIALAFIDETGGGAAPAVSGRGARLRMPEQEPYAAGLERLALARRGTLKHEARLLDAVGELATSCDRLFVISDVPLRLWRGMIERAGAGCPVVCLDSERLVPIPRRLSTPASPGEISSGGRSPDNPDPR